MKIRQQLALRFTIVSSLITGAILIFIFVLTRGFVNADFVERLTQQSRLEVLHYATPQVKDVMPPGSFLLVNPETSIYSTQGALLHQQGPYAIPVSWIAYMKENAEFNAERGEYTTVGRKYNINGKTYIVFVSDKDLPGQHELDILVKAVLIGWLMSIVFSYLAGLYFSGNALEPVKHVVKEVNLITKDNLSYRLQLTKNSATPDEIDELILTFNALLTRIETAFVTQKRFVQHASHELKTPLTAIMAEAELALARDRSTGEYKRTLEVIAHETDRLVTITQGLLTLARLEEGLEQTEMRRVSIKAILDGVSESFQLHYPQRELVVNVARSPEYILGYDNLLQMALLNMLDNAVKYSKDKIILSVDQTAEHVIVGVRDYGIGIPAQEVSRVRSPLFRASNVRGISGAGLGLSLVDRIAKAHGGQLEIKSEEGRGTYCEIILSVSKDN